MPTPCDNFAATMKTEFELREKEYSAAGNQYTPHQAGMHKNHLFSPLDEHPHRAFSPPLRNETRFMQSRSFNAFALNKQPATSPIQHEQVHDNTDEGYATNDNVIHNNSWDDEWVSENDEKMF